MKFLKLLLIFTLLVSKVFALEIIYPKQSGHSVESTTSFFVGNTKKDSRLFINSEEVKLYDNGAFTHVVNLLDGENKFELKSVTKDEVETVHFVINKTTKAVINLLANKFIPLGENEFLVAKVRKDYSPLRSDASYDAKRLSHLEKGAYLMLDGEQSSFFRVALSQDKSVWVAKDHIEIESNSVMRDLIELQSVEEYEDKKFSYLKIGLSKKAPYILTKLKAPQSGFNLEIYNLQSANQVVNSTFTKNINKPKIFGYDSYYDGNNLIVKIAKTPQIDPQAPLKNVTVLLDAGHGGSESGAVSCVGMKEKEVNLDITLKLKKELEDAGAKVVLTRDKDNFVGLYERVGMSKTSNALVSLSIHANALPDGLDPMLKRGTSVFYYDEQAKTLADCIKTEMLKELKTKDDGTNFASFVMTRTTMPVSVLIEVAYLIHPEESNWLLDDNFRQKTALSIKNGLEKFLISNFVK